MGNLDSEYPTEQQIEEFYKAYKKGGRQGIVSFLEEQRRKREAETGREMEKRQSEYPTEEQMRETYEAYKTGKPGAIAEVLRKRKREREEAHGKNAKDGPECA